MVEHPGHVKTFPREMCMTIPGTRGPSRKRSGTFPYEVDPVPVTTEGGLRESSSRNKFPKIEKDTWRIFGISHKDPT